MADSTDDSKPNISSPSGTLAPDDSNATSSATEPASTSVSDTQTATVGDTQPQPSTNDSSLDAKQERDIDAEINHTATAPGMSMETSNDQAPSAQSQPALAAEMPNGLEDLPAVLEPRIPQKKDTSLREFLGKMDDYAPLIPDAVTDYYLTLAGLPPPPETDRRLARLLALATQKFIADIASDAYQYSRIRSTNTTSNNPLTGLGGAAGFGLPPIAGDEGAGKGKKDAGKAAPLGGPRAGYGGGGANAAQGRTVLTMEDLGMAVGEYGVNVKRGEFYR